jgi:hypothetical protein
MYKRFAIIDDYGTIHSSTEEEMRLAITAMTDSDSLVGTKSDILKLKAKYYSPWVGDLKLVEIHKLYK